MKVTSHSWKSWVLCLSLSLISFTVHAQSVDFSGDSEEIAAASPPEESRNYYTFQENDDADSQGWQGPAELFHAAASMVDEATRAGVSLLKWVVHNDPPPTPVEPYKRRQHFGGWMSDPSHQTCYNTRAQILMRDSTKAVTFSSSNHCVVATGLWKDPYSGNLFESARQIQIDHMVPLKNVYLSGGSSWTPKHRCTYANFVKDDYHLIAVSGHENMSKGDDTPADYLPPDEAYVCTYLKHWMMVKMTWHLFMTDREVQAISNAMKEHHCSGSAMEMDKNDLRNLRIAMQDESACSNFGEPRDSSESTVLQ